MTLIKDPSELYDWNYYFITGIEGIVKLARYSDDSGYFIVGDFVEQFKFEDLETIIHIGV